MKIKKCEFLSDKWGCYLTPLIGYSWNEKYGKSIWIGWLRWLCVIHFEYPKEETKLKDWT